MAVTGLEDQIEAVEGTRQGDANASEACEHTEFPASIEEEAPVAVPDLEADDFDDVARLGENSNTVQVQGDGVAETISTAPGHFSTEHEPPQNAEGKTTPPATPVQEA